MSEEELKNPVVSEPVAQDAAGVLPVRAGERSGSSVLGTAVVVGAGALIAGRILGGGLLSGIAGVVAGTMAGRAMARKEGVGAVEDVFVEPEVAADFDGDGDGDGALLVEEFVDWGSEEEVVGNKELEESVIEDEVVAEEVAEEDVVAEEVVEEEEIDRGGKVGDVDEGLPIGFGELIAGSLEVETTEDAGEEGDDAVGATLFIDDLEAIYDEAVAAEFTEEGEVEEVEEVVEEAVEEAVVEAVEEEVEPEVVEEAEPVVGRVDVAATDVAATEEEAEESEAEAEVAVVTEEEIEIPIDAELTPDEIWEMEALGRFTPAEVEDSDETAEAEEDGVAADGGERLFPTRAELIGNEKDVALGTGFFTSVGAFDDVDDSDEESGDEEPEAEAVAIENPFLEFVPEPEPEPEFPKVPEKFDKPFEISLNEPAAAKGEVVEVGALFGAVPEGKESGGVVVEKRVVDLEPHFQVGVTGESQEKRSRLRPVVLAVFVLTAVAGGGIALFSTGIGRPVVEWAAAFLNGETGDVEEKEAELVAPIEEVVGGETAPLEVVPPVTETGMAGDVVEEVRPVVPEEGAGAVEAIEMLPALLSGEPGLVGEEKEEDRSEGLVTVGTVEGGVEDVRDEVTREIDPSDAKSVLMGFLRSDTVEQLLEAIHGGERVEQEVRNYYPSGKVPRVRVEDVRLEVSATVPSSQQETHLFVVQLEGVGVGIPVSVENTDAGYRIDWEAYVQCRDRLLARFAETGEDVGASGGYYVVMKRSHYFKEDVPDLEGKLCFHMTSPLPGDAGVYVFADKRTKEARELGTKMRWGALYFPVVRLSRVENPGGEPYLVLLEVVRDQWRAN